MEYKKCHLHWTTYQSRDLPNGEWLANGYVVVDTDKASEHTNFYTAKPHKTEKDAEDAFLKIAKDFVDIEVPKKFRPIENH